MSVNVTWNGAAAKAGAAGAIARGVTMGAHRVQAVTVPRTPMDLGDLRSSLIVDPATAGEPVATVSSDLSYAVAQHEDLAYHHKHGRAKYLESALIDTRGEVQQIIAEQIRLGLEG